MEHEHSQTRPARRDYWGLRYILGVAATLGIVAFFLLTEHRAHLYGALPYLLLIACPLMHFFMHGRHGHHRGRHGAEDDVDSHRGKRSRHSATGLHHRNGESS